MKSPILRGLVLATGLGCLLLGRIWATLPLDAAPLAGYSFEWFLKLGPSEGSFLMRYLLIGTLGGSLVAWGSQLWLRRAVGLLAERFTGWGAMMVLAFAAVGLVTGIAFGVLQDLPVTDDEYVYAFQSRALLTGHAALPAQTMPEFLENVFVITREGRWLGQYPPGHPIALMPAVAVGLPRLTPIVLTLVNVLLTGAILRMFVGPGWAVLGVLLLAGSPLFVLTGATLLSHSTAYLGFSLGLLGALRQDSGKGMRWGVISGLGMGLLFLTRPWTGVTLSLLPLGILIVSATRSRRYTGIVAAAVPAALCLGVFLLYNLATTGDALLTGYQAVRGTGVNEFGFGTIIPGFHDHTPLQGLRNAGVLGLRFMFWSFGLIGVPALVFALRHRPSEHTGSEGRISEQALVWAALGTVGLGVLSYVPYWSIGVNDTGPVKTYELLLPLGVLVTVGLRNWAERHGAAAPVSVALGATLASVLIFWPVQVTQIESVIANVARPLTVARDQVQEPALIFVGSMQPKTPGSWVFGRPNPEPDLSDPILWVRDRGKDNVNYRRLHPSRRAYRLTFSGSEPRLESLGPGSANQ